MQWFRRSELPDGGSKIGVNSEIVTNEALAVFSWHCDVAAATGKTQQIGRNDVLIMGCNAWCQQRNCHK